MGLLGEAGGCNQGFALQAGALGLQHAFMNQAVEIASVRKRLTAHLGETTKRPDFIVRFGFGPQMPRSPRRPAAQTTASA